MTSIYFSPKGTAQATARVITSAWEGATERNLLTEPLREPVVIPAGEPVLVAMPVYAGRIPGLCRKMLERYLQGSGGPAVAVAVYGNRDYDNALAERQDLLESKGLQVVAAGASFGTECRRRALPPSAPSGGNQRPFSKSSDGLTGPEPAAQCRPGKNRPTPESGRRPADPGCGRCPP